MTKLEKIIKLSFHYHLEIFDQGCLDLENDMTDNEIQQAINLAKGSGRILKQGLASGRWA